MADGLLCRATRCARAQQGEEHERNGDDAERHVQPEDRLPVPALDDCAADQRSGGDAETSSRVDGPYAEAKEVVGGWAIMEYATPEEAVADQREFAELHAKYWPQVTVVATLRQISTGPDAAVD